MGFDPKVRVLQAKAHIYAGRSRCDARASSISAYVDADGAFHSCVYDEPEKYTRAPAYLVSVSSPQVLGRDKVLVITEHLIERLTDDEFMDDLDACLRSAVDEHISQVAPDQADDDDNNRRAAVNKHILRTAKNGLG